MGATQVERDGIKDDAISSEKIPDNAVGTSEIADGAITLAKLANGSSDGLVLTSNDGSAPTFNTPTVEGTDVKSTNISGTTKYLRADGDGTCSWDVPTGASVVTTGADGLAPQLPNPHGGKFLKADGTWTVPYYAVSGTDAPGLVPALPDSSVQTINFLRGDGSWAELNYTVSSTTTGDVGTDASVSLSGNAFSFTIPRGDTGATGPDGAQGEQGIQGIPGTNGTNGVDGADGADGTNGTNGTDGADGADGADGTNGADGADGADGLFTSYAHLEDQKAYNVNGGQASQGNQVRDLNTEKFDPDGIILGFNGNATSGNLKANGTNYSETTTASQFVLGAGTYLIRASTPQIGLGRIQTRLGVLVGSTYIYTAASPISFSNTTVEARPELFHRFTISVTSTYVIIMWCGAASTNSYSKGVASGTSAGYGTSLNSIYTVVDIYKE